MEIKSGVLQGRGEFDWQANGNSPIVRKELMAVDVVLAAECNFSAIKLV